MSFIENPNAIPAPTKKDAKPVKPGKEQVSLSAAELNSLISALLALRALVVGGTTQLDGSWLIPGTVVDTQARLTLQELLSDGKLTPPEKVSLLLTYKGLVQTRSVLETQATSYTVSHATYSAAIDALIAQMVAIGLKVGPPIDAGPSSIGDWLVSTSDISDPAAFRQKFENAMVEEKSLQAALQDRLRTIVDSVKYQLPATFNWESFDASLWMIALPQMDESQPGQTNEDSWIGHDFPFPFGGASS